MGASCAQRGHLVQVLVARTAPFDFCQFRPVAGRAPEITRKKTRLPDSNSKKPAAGTSAAGTAVDIFIPSLLYGRKDELGTPVKEFHTYLHYIFCPGCPFFL